MTHGIVDAKSELTAPHQHNEDSQLPSSHCSHLLDTLAAAGKARVSGRIAKRLHMVTTHNLIHDRIESKRDPIPREFDHHQPISSLSVSFSQQHPAQVRSGLRRTPGDRVRVCGIRLQTPNAFTFA